VSSEESFDMPTPREEPDQKVRDFGERLGETCILFTIHIMSVFDTELDSHSHCTIVFFTLSAPRPNTETHRNTTEPDLLFLLLLLLDLLLTSALHFACFSEGGGGDGRDGAS
jgi:hypothetical protein